MGKSVLIVDSDQPFAQSAQDALEILGIQVHVVDDASFDVVRRIRPTVLLLNVELGHKPTAGFSLCSRIRRDKDLKELPIFLTSSAATPQSLEKHASSTDRADDYAIKPIAIEELIGRLTEMLEAAPEPTHSDNGDADEDFDPDLEGDERTPDLPPSMPHARGATGGPPPLRGAPPPLPNAPPPLPKTGDVGARPSERSASIDLAAAPPALPRETPSEGELWPAQRFDEAFRQATATEPEQALGRASPEERLTALRALVKKYQSREKALKSTWDEVMQRGADLARQTAALQAAQQQENTRLEEVIRSRDATVARLKTVEMEFRAFQEEITRIFQEKDAEEASKAEERARLEEENAALREQIQQAHEALSDDQRRLTILQEEIEELEQMRAAHEQATGEIEGLRARLEMVEGVSTDRAHEIQNLQDQLDQLLFEKNNAEQQLERDYQAKLEGVNAEHLAQIEGLEGRHRELLEALSSTHEAEASEFEEKRRAASDQIRALNDRVAELEGQLEAALGKDDRIAELQNALSELEENVDAERSEAGRRIGELEEELDGAQTEMFERLAELDHYKKSATHLESRTKDLETALKNAEKSLKQTKAEATHFRTSFEGATSEKEALAQQTERLEEQLARLEEKDRQTTRMLEEERARTQRAEDLARKATQRAQSDNEELEAKLEEEMASRQELEALLESERNARAELDVQLEDLQGELSRREAELSDAYSEATTLGRRLETSSAEMEARLSSLTAQLDQTQKQSANKDVELHGLKQSIADAGAQLGSLTAEVDSLKGELAEAHARLTAVQQDARALEQSENALIKEIEAKAERVQKLEAMVTKLERELDRAKAESRAMAQRQGLLRKAAGVLEMARRSIPEHFAEAVADAMVQDALKPQVYTGEVEPLDLSDAVDPDYSPPTAVIRQAVLASNLGGSLDDEHAPEPTNDNAAPFAALMAEIEASEDDFALGFDEKFAAETTTENPRVQDEIAQRTERAKMGGSALPNRDPRMGGALSSPAGRRAYEAEEEEEEEGSVTEIIRLDKLD